MRKHLRHIATALLTTGIAIIPTAALAEDQPEPGGTTTADTPADMVPETPAETPTGADGAVGTVTGPGDHDDVSRPPGRSWASVVVDLSEQELVVLSKDGTVLQRWNVSSGSSRTPTPTGRYRVTSKSLRTFASANPRVTMNHMVRFKGGIGFHSIPRLDGTPLATPLGIRGVSHGCIRLADANARLLYRNLPVGAEVIVKP